MPMIASRAVLMTRRGKFISSHAVAKFSQCGAKVHAPSSVRYEPSHDDDSGRRVGGIDELALLATLLGQRQSRVVPSGIGTW